MQYSESNLDFVKAEGFTSAQLRLNPDELNDAAIAGIKDKIAKSGIYISSLAVDGNHIDPDPAKREQQNGYTLKCLDLCGKLGDVYKRQTLARSGAATTCRRRCFPCPSHTRWLASGYGANRCRWRRK